MRQSTKTSSLAAPVLLWAAVALFVAASAWGAVVAEVGAPVGDGPVAAARRKALDGAQAQAVTTLLERHVEPARRQARKGELRKLIAKNSRYILRYSIEEEGELSYPVEEGGEPQHRYRVVVSAEVDRARLLTDLEAMGVAVKKLSLKPRLLVMAPGDEPSAAGANLLRERFGQEGLDAGLDLTLVLPEEAAEQGGPSGAEDGVTVVEPGEHYVVTDEGEVRQLDPFTRQLIESAAQTGAHIAVVVQLREVLPEDGEEAEKKDPHAWIDEEPSEAGEAEEPPLLTVEYEANGGLVDVRNGSWLSRVELTHKGRDVDSAVAAKRAIKGASERAFQQLMAGLVQSGWTLGETSSQLTLRVAGLASPGPMNSIWEALRGVAEFETVSLSRVESGAAVWEVEALSSGYDWLGVLSRVKVAGGELQWAASVPAGSAPTTEATDSYEGRWTDR